MFENGLDYIRADFHLHTRKDKEFTYEGEDNDFINAYVSALKNSHIGVGVITNHNKFDVGEFKGIRKTAARDNILILPGVELTVKEGANGIHTLIVFDPDQWLENGSNHIQTFLSSAFATIPNPENRNVKCTFDLKRTIETLDEYGRDYFIIFAHVDQNSGLFVECKGGLLHSLSTIASFRDRVLGLQKAHSRDNISLFKQYFEYIPALVEGSDPKSISEIGKGGETFLKIGSLSYSAVKFALQDYKNRIFDSAAEVKHGYVESIAFEGGKFDGQTIRFSPELNTLIGIRGSGKSSILEIIRYIFELSPQADEIYKNELVKSILSSGGKATLSVIDKHGKRYYLSRISGERLCVRDENMKTLLISPLSIIDGMQYFGQKDLSSSFNHESLLLEKIVNNKVVKKANIDDCSGRMKTAISQLLDINMLPSQIEEENTKKADLEHAMSIYREKGVDEKLKKQTGYTTDHEKLKAIGNKISSAFNSLSGCFSSLPVLLSEINGYVSEYNEDIFREVKTLLSEIDLLFKQLKEVYSKINEKNNEYIVILNRLTDKMTDLTEEFAEIKREIKDDTIDPDSFVRMTKELEQCKERIKGLLEKSSSQNSIKEEFESALHNRNELLVEEFNAYKSEIDRINNSQDELRINIEFKGDCESFKTLIKTDFRGTGISDAKYQKMSEVFKDYVDLIADWILESGKQLQSILSPMEYSKLVERLKEQYPDLITKRTANKVDIYYHEKLLRQHSIGQRASALILFILAQKDNDIIIIDQPEDDLDNKIIYDEVISSIVKEKRNTQFIFATHNANIPVLGDAECVHTIDYQDSEINVDQGNIDLSSTHKNIVEIMEGGQEAFRRRRLIYQSWK